MEELVGKKVVLRTATDGDIDALYYWKYEEAGQEAKKWNGPYIPQIQRTKEEYRKLWEQEILSMVPASLVICADGRAIGEVSAYWVDPNTNWLETGIVIYEKAMWNGGYGFEAYRMWIDFLFRTTELHRLGMSTWSGNIRMMKVAQKVGMKLEARIRDARIVDGKYFDAIKMGILRTEWEESYSERHGISDKGQVRGGGSLV